MWSYYGSKSKIVDLYPPPKFDKIIEPFAGSARYSLKYFERDILLVDKYEVVVKIWNHLKQCSVDDIKKLPSLTYGDCVKNYTFSCEAEQLLMRYMVCGGSAVPVWNVSTKGFGGGVEATKKNIIKNLHKIKHWSIILADYRELNNENATWFIDPPYQFGGHKYPMSNKKLDFGSLSEWCKSRNGQIIVCENTKATWMDFKPMKNQRGVKFTTTEAIWSNEKTNYDNVQQTIEL